MEGVGGAIGSLFGVAGSAAEIAAGFKQIDEAKKVRRGADYVQKEKLRPEWNQKLRTEEMAAAAGLPGKEKYETLFEQQTANQLKNIRRVSPSPSSTLAAMAAALSEENVRKQQLDAVEAEGRRKAQGQVGNTLAQIGTQERALELEQTRKQENILSAADQLEKAGTANVYGGLNKGLSAMSMGSNSLFTGLAKNSVVTDESTELASKSEQPQITAPSAGTQYQTDSNLQSNMIADPSQMAALQTVSTNPSQNQANFWNQNNGALTPTQATSQFTALPQADQIAFAKSKNILGLQATDADYIQLLKDPSIIKQLMDAYGK